MNCPGQRSPSREPHNQLERRRGAARVAPCRAARSRLVLQERRHYAISLAAWLLVLVSTMPAEAQRRVPLPEEIDREDPAVEAILETKPSTPAELTRAAKILADLGRADLGKDMLANVLQAELNQRQLASLAEQFGTNLFTSLASRPELAPEGQQLSDAVLNAYRATLQDPKRLSGLIAKLDDPSAEVRYRALAGLLEARASAVPPLLSVLADPQKASLHPRVLGVFDRLESDAIGPLLAILESKDPPLVAAAARALAAVDADEAAIFLFAPLFSPHSAPEVRQAATEAVEDLVGKLPQREQAARILGQRARQYFDRRQPLPSAEEGKSRLWVWNAEADSPEARLYATDDAALVMAARLARHAHRIAPGDDELRLLHLATGLELASYAAGLDKPLTIAGHPAVATVADFGVPVVEQLLEFGLAQDHAPVAAAAARILGLIAESNDALYRGATPAPLVQAAEHPDPRVRLAAVEAIMQLQPTAPYAGSSRVLDSLAFFITGSGRRMAVVGAPSNQATQHLIGFLSALGYEVEPASVGVDTVRSAIASPDVELILLDATIEQPRASLVYQQLRRDYRTARVPVGIIAPAGTLESAERIVGDDALAEAFPRARSEEALKWQVARLKRRIGRFAFSPDERLAAAHKSLGWLRELAEEEEWMYDLLSIESTVVEAVLNPSLSVEALGILAHFGTARSQQTLTDVASRFTLPLEVRRAAVGAFCRSVQEHGILLTSEEIEQQYARYNRSETLDRPTQQLLGILLDCLEAPTAPLDAEQTMVGNTVE